MMISKPIYANHIISERQSQERRKKLLIFKIFPKINVQDVQPLTFENSYVFMHFHIKYLFTMDNPISRNKAVFFRAPVRATPHSMGPVLLLEETRVLGENLRCLVKSSCTTLLSHVAKVTLTRPLHRAKTEPESHLIKEISQNNCHLISS